MSASPCPKAGSILTGWAHLSTASARSRRASFRASPRAPRQRFVATRRRPSGDRYLHPTRPGRIRISFAGSSARSHRHHVDRAFRPTRTPTACTATRTTPVHPTATNRWTTNRLGRHRLREADRVGIGSFCGARLSKYSSALVSRRPSNDSRHVADHPVIVAFMDWPDKLTTR